MANFMQIIGAWGGRAALLSVQHLKQLKEEYEDLARRENLSEYQQKLVRERFSYELPDTDFEIKSIVVIATPSPQTQVLFHYKGKQYPVIIPPTYLEYDIVPEQLLTELQEFLSEQDYHMIITKALPHKYLAVRSGLGEYGRNNLCYIDGMGSFALLSVYYSDIPYPEEGMKDSVCMEICNRCLACVRNCPTGAILKDRFLIDCERCLTYLNEPDGTQFPEWVDSSWHNALVGCRKCQSVCPANRQVQEQILESLEFTEVETEILLNGATPDQLPAELKEKTDRVNMTSYLGALPRNLKVLLI